MQAILLYCFAVQQQTSTITRQEFYFLYLNVSAEPQEF